MPIDQAYCDFLINTDVITGYKRKFIQFHYITNKYIFHHGHIVEQQFFDIWLSSLDDKNKNNTSLSAEKYRQQLNLYLVKQARSNDGNKSVEQYNASKRFNVLSIGDVEKLVKERKTEDEPILYFTSKEELYSKIKEHHVQQGHGGINKMMAHILLS